LTIVSFVLVESYADLVHHSGMKSSFLWHCSAPAFGERVWTRLTSWLPIAPFIEQRRVLWKYPECNFPQPHFLPRFLPLMSYDLLRASLILHQAPQGSVTFPNDPWPSTNLHDLPCCSGRFRNDFCYPPYNLCKLISSINQYLPAGHKDISLERVYCIYIQCMTIDSSLTHNIDL
jgi:hypothetical protein